MKGSPRFPLLAKVIGWLCLHLMILGLSFFGIVRWQLGLGLDSLLSGAAGERLGAFGDGVVAGLDDLPVWQWNDRIQSIGKLQRMEFIDSIQHQPAARSRDTVRVIQK